MITVKMDFDLRKINLDLSKELNLAGQIISKDHFTRLERGQDANEKQMTPLKDATIERKGFKAKTSIENGIKELIDVFTYSNETIINNY